MQAQPPTAEAPPSGQTETVPAVTPPPVAPAPPPEPRPRLTIELIKALPNTELKDRYINTLIEAEMEREAFDMDQRRARVFALSGEFADIRGQTLEQSIAKAMAKIQLGRSWGFSPGDSMRNIYFTNGRPNVENTLVASKLQQAGWGWDPKFDYDDIQHKGKPYKRCIGCTLWLKKFDPETQTYKPVLDRDGDQVHEFFTLAEAEQIKVYEKGNTQPLADKFNYQSWPREMYYWRSVGRIHKFHAPHILRGGVIREEALDVIPGDAPPEMLPPEIQAAALEPPPAAPSKTKRKQLRDEILAQESLLEKPDAKE